MFDDEMFKNEGWENHITFNEQIAREYAKKVDEAIKQKLIALSYKALQEREYKLYDILHEIESENINGEMLERFKEKLHEYGYFLNVEMPEATLSESTIKLEHTEGYDESSKVGITFNPNEIKVSVYKEIMTI